MRAHPKFSRWLIMALLATPVVGCSFLGSFAPKAGDSTDVIDRSKNLTIKDFRDLSVIDKEVAAVNAKNATAEANVTTALGAPPIPDIAQVLAAPRPPKVANTKLVTLAVTDDVPLRDVLFELGRLANVDIEVGPGLDRYGINLRATDRPFNEVIERIATLGNLRYSTTGSSIRVERDLPYIKNYSLDFLNIVRSSKSGYSLSTNVISGGGLASGSDSSTGGSSSGSGAGGGGSQSSIDSSADSDLWSSLEASVNEILSYSPDGESTGAAASSVATATTATTTNTPTGTSSTTASATRATGPAGVVVNRQAGVLSVNATERQHEMIQNFLTMMSRNASAQVLIEAKIVEVALSDQFASGVDWNRVIGDVQKTRLGVGQYLPLVPSTGIGLPTGLSSVPGNINSGTGIAAMTFGIDQGDLGAVLALTQTFGTTRTLSSPRLSAINNQQAVLTFARNSVYFDCTYTPASTTGVSGSSSGSTTTQASLTCSQRTVPIGIILSILPSVNLDTQEVTLNVRPTLTRQVDIAKSPVTGFLKSIATDATAASQIPDITVPVIESREIDSITKVKSGGVMVIGGLMEDVTRNNETGVPGFAEVPLVGNLFKSRSEDTSKRELIIFIKATIVNSDGSAHKVDRAVYDKYITDPRPLYPHQP